LRAVEEVVPLELWNCGAINKTIKLTGSMIEIVLLLYY